MAYAEAADARLYYEDCGSGFPVVLGHELAGDFRGWVPQHRFFGRM